jgi:cytochrome c oxidase subunit II
MGYRLPLFPEQASTLAPRVDALYAFLVIVTGFFSVLIAALVIIFAIKYRRRSEDYVPRPIAGALRLEILWIGVPLLISMVMFAWGASVYMGQNRPPDDAEQIYVVGKQWMWKVQHLDGHREINELHVPLGKAFRLTMTSEDVIHSFFMPAFRTKFDVLPGKYTTAWFRPIKTGTFHLFCAEYCGTKHSGMIGWIHVMQPSEYQAWLTGGAPEGSLASSGEKLFQDLACNNCHHVGDGAQGRCPNLQGLFGRRVELASGATVVADEAYIRESILKPDAKIVSGYQAIMPTFDGLVTEEGVLQLIEYIKSIGPKNQGTGSPAGGTPAVANPSGAEGGPPKTTTGSNAVTEPRKR